MCLFLYSFVFCLTQVLRGDTYNLIYVDESCFVKPTVYQEVVPMLQTNCGHMVLTSSHKSGKQSAKSFIDMQLLRRKEIVVNNVCFVCPNHLTAILSDTSTASTCSCYIFAQPAHITTDCGYRNVLNAFGKRAGGKETDEDTNAASKASLMSEIGILPETLEAMRAASSIGSTHALASDAGAEKFCTQLCDVSELLAESEECAWSVLPTVYVYIDLAPTDVGSSLHAMCFVAVVTGTQKPGGERGGTKFLREDKSKYVVLAVEEFATMDVDSQNVDGLRALAIVFIHTCYALTCKYEGFFQTYVVAPEANSVSVSPFWDECGRLFYSSTVLQANSINILCTTIGSLKTSREDIRQRTISNLVIPRGEVTHRMGRSHNVSHTYITNLIDPHNTTSVSSVARNRREGGGERPVYRVGYALGSDKVARIYHFFVSVFNNVSCSSKQIVCAKNVWSWWISQRTGDSIPVHICNALRQLEVRPNYRGNKTSLKISGKRHTAQRGYVQDDLAICVVMSVCLCEDINTGMYKGELVRLENKETQGRYSVQGDCFF